MKLREFPAIQISKCIIEHHREMIGRQGATKRISSSQGTKYLPTIREFKAICISNTERRALLEATLRTPLTLIHRHQEPLEHEIMFTKLIPNIEY